MNIQFKKGVLELCVLSLLTKQNRYGYELVNEISKNIEISEGTIYPLLRRLKNENYVTTYLEESKEGAPRKYYKLTESGKKINDLIRKDWNEFVEKVNHLLEEGCDINE
ncbi:MAG TPA: PadR family transcriptional regulator [Actinobacteria bacterium]|nr:PadR family transcriptional regulator [Actinomycetota bacterium]